MKKAICLMLSAALVFILSSLCVFAEGEKTDSKQKKLTVFGDSISAGYSLDDYVNSDLYRSKKCFSSIIADKLGAEPNKDYYNFSHAGWTSSQILYSIKNANPDIVKNSDYILISAGANEIMDIVEETIYGIFYGDTQNMIKYSSALSKLRSSPIVSALFSESDDPEVKELLDFVFDKCTDETAMSKYNSAVDLYENNIREMVTYIRSTGSDAEIVFLPPYNPTAVVKNNKLVETLQIVLSAISSRTTAFSNSIGDGSVHTVDLLASFDGRYPVVTYILKGDIHPNETGHSEIARLISEELKLDEKNDSNSSSEELSEVSSEQKAESTENSSEDIYFGDKDAPVNNTVVFIIFGVAAVLAVCIVVHFVFSYRKK